MRISNLRIHNFRSIETLSIDCGSFLTLLGPNNHGKSNIRAALEFGLSTSAKPTEQDFFAYRNSDDDELWVQMTFADLTEQEKHTFRRYVLTDQTLCIVKTARLSNGTVEIFYNGCIEQPEEEWLRAENAGNYASQDKVDQLPLRSFIPKSGRVSKQSIENAQQQYIEVHRSDLDFSRTFETGPLLGQKNVAGGLLPELILIPAVRDLTDEIKMRNTTTFGRLMNRAVREMAERDERFIRARSELETVIASLNERNDKDEKTNELLILEQGIESELAAWEVKVNIEIMPPELEKLFELGTDIHIDDGVRTTAERKGHGLQRAMIFALLRSWASALQAERQARDDGEISARRQSNSVIFAMEEPELFLHPHAQRRLASSLRGIAASPEHQVFLCTHSTHFVDLGHYSEIAIITKKNAREGSKVKQCTGELFEGDDIVDRKRKFNMAQWINPDRGELFFARRIVFVEGATEHATIPLLAEKLGIFDPEVSVVDCGAKHNIPLYMSIANAFQLPYLVVHDEDPLPDPMPESEDERRSKLATFELNQKIEEDLDGTYGEVVVMSDDFENAGGVPRSQGKRKGKPLAALDHFDSMPVAEIPPDVKRLIEAACRNS